MRDQLETRLKVQGFEFVDRITPDDSLRVFTVNLSEMDPDEIRVIPDYKFKSSYGPTLANPRPYYRIYVRKKY